MTKEQYLIQKLQEECAEIILIASKYNLFGPESHHPNNPELGTNRENLGREIMDLMAVVYMLGDEGLLTPKTPEEAEDSINRKRTKVEFYMERSRDLGILEREIVHPESTD